MTASAPETTGTARPARRAKAAKPATMGQAIGRALRDAMAEDPAVHVLGEDVGTLGGVFRITDGLAAEFGDDRCTDTPLAEAGILGTACRHGHVRPAPGGGDAVRRLRLPVVRATRLARREDAQPHPGRHAPADHHPRPLRRRHRRRRAPQRLLRGVLRGHARPARGHPGDRRGRVRAAACRHRLGRPGRLHGAQAAVLVEVRLVARGARRGRSRSGGPWSAAPAPTRRC